MCDAVVQAFLCIRYSSGSSLADVKLFWLKIKKKKELKSKIYTFFPSMIVWCSGSSFGMNCLLLWFRSRLNLFETKVAYN